MIKNVLSDIGGIGIYGVISICLFFAVFTGALVWSLLLKKADLDSRSLLPLDDGVRPSPAADTSVNSAVSDYSQATACCSAVSAPEDGRTPAAPHFNPL
jgi:hypothetical protein